MWVIGDSTFFIKFYMLIQHIKLYEKSTLTFFVYIWTKLIYFVNHFISSVCKNMKTIKILVYINKKIKIRKPQNNQCLIISDYHFQVIVILVSTSKLPRLSPSRYSLNSTLISLNLIAISIRECRSEFIVLIAIKFH